MQQWISFTGLDAFFFRDARPFSKGQTVRAGTVFPPLPSVLRGALRTDYFSRHPERFSHAASEKDPTACFRIKCMLLYSPKTQQYLIKAPQNLVRVDEKDGKETIKYVRKLTLTPAPAVSSYTLPKVLTADFEYTNPDNDDYVTLSDYMDLINGIVEKISVKDLSAYISHYKKIGIAKSATSGTSNEGNLYQTEMFVPYDKHLEPLELVALADMPNEVFGDIMRLGGEGKLAHVKPHSFSEAMQEKLLQRHNDTTYFTITLLTPAIFNSGWKKDDINLSNIEAKLIAACVTRPIAISGYDMKAGKPKPLYHAASAGCVYYYELIRGEMKDVYERFHKKNISEKLLEERLGYCIVGGI